MSSEGHSRRGGLVPLFLALISAALAVIYVLEWRASRGLAQDLMRKASVGDASVRSLTQAVLRNQALLDRLQGVLEGLKTLPRDQGAASSETAPETLAESPPVPGGDEVKKESLPPLPPGTRGRVVLTADLDRLLSDGKLNPEKKELSRL
jgi:hypothetical protein